MLSPPFTQIQYTGPHVDIMPVSKLLILKEFSPNAIIIRPFVSFSSVIPVHCLHSFISYYSYPNNRVNIAHDQVHLEELHTSIKAHWR